MDNPCDFIDPDKCPKCKGYLNYHVDMVDASSYIGCSKGCTRIDPEDFFERYDAFDASCDKADEKYHENH